VGEASAWTKVIGDVGFDQALRGFEVMKVTPCIVADFSSRQSSPAGAPEFLPRDYNELGGLLQLVQLLTLRRGTDPLHLGILTSGLYRVTGREDLQPAKALLLGPARVLAQEVPGASCEVVDLELPAPASPDEQRLFVHLVTELLERRRDPFVAYRGDRRWTCVFENVILGQERKPKRLRERGVYLITGGLGGLGLEIAEFLARSVKAGLVLINRTPFPSREQWNGYAEQHGPEDSTSRRISRLMALEAMGAKILVLTADVSEQESLRKAVSSAVDHFGAIHGLVHAAGSAGGGILALQSIQKMDAILKSKATGTVLLKEMLRGQELDFMVLFSSHVSILGGVGRADYAGANAFLDAFACSQMDRPGVVTAVNWDTWSEAGMAADESLRQNLGPVQDAMSSASGVEAFRRILSCEFPQVIVSLQDFATRLQQALSQTAARFLETAEHELFSAKQSLHERPELTNSYDPPATPQERSIVNIWEDLLGIRGIGAEDNFFELGGDSVVGIQVVAQLRKAGLQATPKQVFEHVTPRALATVLNTRSVHADQGLVVGDVPLTPVQCWFLERSLSRRNLFNQDVVVTLTRDIDETLLEQAFQKIVQHHDALRLRVEAGEAGWAQRIADFEPIALMSFDLSGISTELQAAALEQAAAGIQDSLSLCEGPIVRPALFKFGKEQAARLLIVIHHIAIDGTSWPILLEDLQTCYFQQTLGQQPELPPKTTSFHHWSRRLKEYACLKSVERESRYWLSEERRNVTTLLPRDFGDGVNLESTLQWFPVRFSKQQTEDLMKSGMKLGAQAHEILLASVSKALHSWTAASEILVDVEGLGREPLFEDVDLSRTVGWFTAIYPLLLFCPVAGEMYDLLESVQNQVRSVPKGGIGYGLLRYMGSNQRIASDLRLLQQPEICFLYAGRTSQEFPGDSLFGFAPESSGISRAPEQKRSYLIDIYARIIEGSLVVEWGYSSAVHRKQTIENVADQFRSSVSAFIQLGMQREFSSAAPSSNEFGWTNSELLRIHRVIEESNAAPY
jgi:non-ribosomal peptide synthase protein (TIGR01720 family)